MDIFFIGDVAFTGIVSTQPEKNKERYQKVSTLLHRSDLVFANLEVPIKIDESQNKYKNFIHFSLKGPTIELLKTLNIGCVSLANNHIYDCNMSGIQATINTLDQLHISHTGAGWLPEHISPVIIKKGKETIAFIAYVDASTNPKTEFFPELYINYFNIEKVIEKIKELKEQSINKIICSIHWGVDYSFYPTMDQRNIAKLLVEAGADIIMGHHPHTLQPFEEYNRGKIFYSLGGLTFGDFVYKNKLVALCRKSKSSVIVKMDLENLKTTFYGTKEKQGNYIDITNRNYLKWSNQKWVHYKLKNSSLISKQLYNFKENVLDRIFEYFFGYYMNPFKRLFQIHNYKKISRLIKKK
jgi:hypothetical protein